MTNKQEIEPSRELIEATAAELYPLGYKTVTPWERYVSLVGLKNPHMEVARWHLSKLTPLQDRIKELEGALKAHVKWHEDYDEYGGWPESDLYELTHKALNPTAKTI